MRGRAGSKRRMILLTIGLLLCCLVTGWGADYFRLREPIPHCKVWFLPSEFRFERFRIGERDFLAIGFIEARLHYGLMGVSPFRRIVVNLSLGLSFKFIVG